MKKISSRLIPVTGEDFSETFFNTEINESYHGKIGPLIEARYKFVEPTPIKDLISENKKVKILDPFFGLGYNSGFAILYAYEFSNSPKIEITAIEKDIEIINRIKDIKVPENYLSWKERLSMLSKSKNLAFENISIKLDLDSIHNKINILQKKYFDVIFFDPFSHKSMPEFWTDEFIISMLDLLSPGGTLTTYSKLKRVEDLAKNLGYITKRIKTPGKKKHSLAITNPML